MSETFAPSAARFNAQFAAPPGTVSVDSCRKIKTGASRDTRAIAPVRNLSAILSPTISSFRSGKRLTILSSRSGSISFDDLLHRIQQIFRNNLRLDRPRSSLVFPLAAPVTTQHERRVQSRILREFDIAVAIAHHPASCEIDLEVPRGALDQTGPGLAAVAV